MSLNVLLHDLHLAFAGPTSSFAKPAQQNFLKQTFSCKSCLLACDACENNRKHSGRPHRLSKPTRGSGTRTHARKPHRLSRPTSQPPAPTSSPAASTRGDPISLASRRAGAGLEPTRANPTGEVSLDAILFQLQSDVGYGVPYQRLMCSKCMLTLWVLFVKFKAPETNKEAILCKYDTRITLKALPGTNAWQEQVS